MIGALAIAAAAALVVLLVLGARWLSYLDWRSNLVRYVLTLPAGTPSSDVATWLSSLAALTHAARGSLVPSPPVVFEAIATDSGVEHALVLPASLVSAALASLRAALPGVRLRQTPLLARSAGSTVAAATVLLHGRRRQLAVERAEPLSR